MWPGLNAEGTPLLPVFGITKHHNPKADVPLSKNQELLHCRPQVVSIQTGGYE